MVVTVSDTRGPDFIVIGARKSATTWLYKLAERLPEVHMPAVKEMNLFIQSRLWSDKDVQPAIHELMDRWCERHVPRAEDIRAMCPEIAAGAQVKDAFDWYAGIFDNLRVGAAGRSGDVSPLYQNLPAARVARIAEEFPNTQIIYIIREPVSRLWSDFVMQVVKNQGLEPESTPDHVVLDLILTTTIRGGLYSEVYQQWKSAFGDRFHLRFFDDLRNDPENFAQDFCSLLNIPYEGGAGAATSNPNPGKKVECPAEVRRELAHIVTPDLRRLLDLHGPEPIIQQWVADLEAL